MIQIKSKSPSPQMKELPKNPKEWSVLAYTFIEKLASSYRPFTSKDLQQVAYANGLPPTSTPILWGQVLLRAQRNGLIRKFGEQASPDKKNPNRMVPIWVGASYPKTKEGV